MRRIAIIPARSGSKGLKDKNILNLNGKPLLAWSIEAALDCKLFDKVVVSTDSAHYADIAKKYGAEISMRSADLASDKTSTFQVIENLLQREPISFDELVLLQPTSPLRTSHHIQEAIHKFENSFEKFDFLASVCEAKHASVLVKPIENDGSLKHFDADFSNYTRQKNKEYTPNGAIFIAKPQSYLKQKHFFGARSQAYIMASKDSIDIDTIIDFHLAEIIMENQP